MNREEIKQLLPHREPMLLLDEVELNEDGAAVGKYTVRGDEFFLQGHFPGNPIVPGVIQCWSDGREDEGHFRLASDNQRLWRVIPGSGGRYLGLEPAGPALPVEAEVEAAETEAW